MYIDDERCIINFDCLIFLTVYHSLENLNNKFINKQRYQQKKTVANIQSLTNFTHLHRHKHIHNIHAYTSNNPKIQ